MAKFDASKFKTLPDPTPRDRFKYEAEDILCHVRHLSTPRPRVGWIKGHQDVLGVAPDLDTVGCMTIIPLVPFDRRAPYDDIDVAVYPGMSLREVLASWEADDDVASANAIYPGSIEAGCRQLGWIVEPSDDEVWDSYI